MPAEFNSGTKQVSVGREEVCAITQKSKVKCWDYNSGVKKVPSIVNKSEFKEVSAGQHHNCAIDIKGKLVCWPVEEN